MFHWVVLTMMAVTGADAAPADQPTYAERLGWPKGARVCIFHVDDAGMSHDSNIGALDAMTKGVATSTSVMFPCSWVSETAQIVKDHPDLDVGVHVTLTSEWGKYRWAPLAGRQAVPGLCDSEWCMWHDVPDVMMHAKPDEVEAEIRAQLERSLAVGIKPTHLDSHMGTVFANVQFFDRYLKVGIENKIPVMLPAGHMFYMSQKMPFMVALAREMGQKAWDAGLPVLDDLNTGDVPKVKGPEGKKQHVIDFLKTLKPGVTQYIVHCTKVSDTFSQISGSGGMRQAELDAMMDPDVAKTVKDEGIILTTWRELKQRRDQVK